MILSVTFSKPSKDCEKNLGKEYVRIRIWRTASAGLKTSAGQSDFHKDSEKDTLRKNSCKVYDAEFFTQTQSFRKSFTEDELESFIKEHIGTTFKNVVQRTDTQEITTMTNRHGETKTLVKAVKGSNLSSFQKHADKTKNYIIKEGKPVPFLVKLGVMTKEGKIVSQKYDKFRQINRFLEYINDILDDLTARATNGEGFCKDRPLHIADFGCGKSYLTFAVYYFLHEIKGIPVEITGLDLKEDVIADCQKLADESGYENLHFYVGNIAEFSYKHAPDMIITLHACDKATDYALNYAVSQKASAILSVPCCQHQINAELDEVKSQIGDESPFAALTRYGIIKERFAALVTDALRAEILEQNGYSVQVLEFVDMSHTPKNLLIRAVRKRNCENAREENQDRQSAERSLCRTQSLMDALHVSQELDTLLERK